MKHLSTESSCRNRYIYKIGAAEQKSVCSDTDTVRSNNYRSNYIRFNSINDHYTPNFLHETVSSINNSALRSKIQQRQLFTESATEKLSKFEARNKELFVQVNENKTSYEYLNSKDHVFLRAKERNKKLENLINKNIDKFTPKEKESKTKYYIAYTEPNTEYVTTVQSYSSYYMSDELKSQIEQSKEEKEITRKQRIKEEKERVAKSLIEYEKEMKEKSLNIKNEIECMKNANFKLLSSQRSKKKADNESENKYIAERNRKLKEYLDRVYKEEKENKHLMSLTFRNNLNKQLQTQTKSSFK
jgi:hypothetical protein